LNKSAALLWPGTVGKNTGIKAIVSLAKARTVDQVRDAFLNFTAASMNFVYGTADNHIGYISAGRLPIRKD